MSEVAEFDYEQVMVSEQTLAAFRFEAQKPFFNNSRLKSFDEGLEVLRKMPLLEAGIKFSTGVLLYKTLYALKLPKEHVYR